MNSPAPNSDSTVVFRTPEERAQVLRKYWYGLISIVVCIAFIILLGFAGLEQAFEKPPWIPLIKALKDIVSVFATAFLIPTLLFRRNMNELTERLEKDSKQRLATATEMAVHIAPKDEGASESPLLSGLGKAQRQLLCVTLTTDDSSRPSIMSLLKEVLK